VPLVLIALCGSGCRQATSASLGERPEPEQARGTIPSATAPAPARAQTQGGSPDRGASGDAAARGEASLGVADRGIFSDLDARVQIALPAGMSRGAVRATIDAGRRLLVLYHRDWPVKVYPLGGPGELVLGARRIALRPGDRAELAPLLDADRVRELSAGEKPSPGDDDRDGIPDPLDLLIGGYKNSLNAAPYGGGYMLLDYPGGDVPRTNGVCTDVIVRAARNAGLDLQAELQREIRRAPRAFPMVARANAHIDHRRVKTLLPYLERRWDRRRVAVDDPEDPLRPGDVILMDTFPGRSGPDHIGILSDRMGPSGLPMVINSWTDGYEAGEMDLLGFVPVTHRFRYPSR
jgi:uncharacterized protein YijF (DUF1287 family)